MIEKMIVLGGKGGVGKSSISAATAVRLADLYPDKKVLLISFDIAHNISDLFDREVGGTLTQLAGNLWAIEPDVETYAREYTDEFATVMRELMSKMPLVNLVPKLQEFIDDAVTADSIPLALKNSLIFQKILDAEDQNFDLIVADFPPTGNMLALFEIPQSTIQVLLKYSLQVFAEVKEVLRGFKDKVRRFFPFWKSKPGQRDRTDRILEMLNQLEARGERVTRIMKERGSLRLVTIAEKPSYEELKRGAALTAPYIAFEGIHVNKLIPETNAATCAMCRVQREIQDKYLAQIQAEYEAKVIWTSHVLDGEPIGMAGLRKLAREVYGDAAGAEILLD